MGFWSQTKRIARFKAAESRVEESSLYARVMEELEQGHRDKGLWGKALADCEGDETKANARYIKLRVTAIRDLIKVSNDVQESLHEDAETRALDRLDRKIREDAVEARRQAKLLRLSQKTNPSPFREKDPTTRFLKFIFGLIALVIIVGVIGSM